MRRVADMNVSPPGYDVEHCVGNGMFAEALSRSVRGAAIVVGEPGAGKSRLLADVCARRRARDTAVTSVTCMPAAARLPFDPLITLTKSLHGEGRLSSRALHAVTATADSRRLEALRDAFEHVGSLAPLALHIDDLHCADPQTLEALHYCIDRLRDLPLVWNIAMRPGCTESDALAAVLARAQLAAVVELDGLTVDELATLAHAIEPGLALDDTTVARLHERTGGNPFYAELLLHNRIDETAPTLHRALAERVVALTPDALAVAGTLAEHGGPSSVTTLAALARLPAARVTAALATLVESRLLRRAEGGYLFRHGLLRDACSAALDAARAAPDAAPAVHAAEPGTIASLEVAVADASARSPELLAELLHRLGAAYEAADDLQRARDTLERAMAACDSARDEALDVRIRARRAAVEGRLGNPHEGLMLLEPLTERSAARGLHAEVARCCVELCMLAEMIDDAARYERWCRYGLEAVGAGPGGEKTALLTNFAQLAVGKGQLREALALGVAASAAADEHTSAMYRCRAWAVQAQANAMLSNFAAATPLLEQMTPFAHDRRARGIVSLAVAIVNELQDDQGKALAAYAGAVRGDRQEPRREVHELAALTGIVRCACALGSRPPALDALEQLRAASRFGWTIAHRYVHEAEGWLALFDGDTERGSDELVHAAELSHELFWRARLLLRVAEARNDRKLFLRVIESYDAMGSPRAAEIARAAARAHGLRPGRKREAQSALSAREGSVAMLVATGMTNNEIGALLHITARTVEYHVGNILTKCGLRSRVEVATRVAAGQLHTASKNGETISGGRSG